MKSLNVNEEKTDTEICIMYIKRFILGLLIGFFYILFAVIIDITLPFEVAVTFNILSIIAVLILVVVLL